MFYTISSIILLTILGTHILLARMLGASIVQYLFPWVGREYTTPCKRLAIAFGGLISSLALSFSLMALDLEQQPAVQSDADMYLFRRTFNELVRKANVTIDRNLAKLEISREQPKTEPDIRMTGKNSVLRQSANSCLIVFLFQLLPMLPMNGGSVLISIIELIQRKPLEKRAMQTAGLICILFYIILAL